MMRIALLQPNIITYGGITSPPIALLFIGSFLEQHGHDVKIIGRNVDFISVKKIKDFKPDIFGVTSITGAMLIDGLDMLKEFKKYIPDIKVVLGGGDTHNSFFRKWCYRTISLISIVRCNSSATFLLQ